MYMYIVDYAVVLTQSIEIVTKFLAYHENSRHKRRLIWQ